MPDRWRIDLERMTKDHESAPSFGFRASCVRHWALQYIGDIDLNLATSDPSRKNTAPLLAALGYRISNKWLDGIYERFYYRGCEKAKDVVTVLVFLEGAWAIEDGRTFLCDRERSAHIWATRERHRITTERFAKERELDAAMDGWTSTKDRNAEADAWIGIKEALSGSLNRFKKANPELVEKREKDALKRWRRSYARAAKDSRLKPLTPQEAAWPKRMRESRIKAEEKRQRKRDEKIEAAREKTKVEAAIAEEKIMARYSWSKKDA